MGNNLTPVGQLVHFIDKETSVHTAGIIVSGVDATTLDILTFPPGTNQTVLISSVVYSELWEGGTWHWPVDGV